jgi:hypothetical protein
MIFYLLNGPARARCSELCADVTCVLQVRERGLNVFWVRGAQSNTVDRTN